MPTTNLSDHTKAIERSIQRVTSCCLWNEVSRATVYLTPRLTVKATRRCVGKTRIELLLTVGIPNYKEREFIKLCLKVGESFPIKKVQLWWKKNKQRR